MLTTQIAEELKAVIREVPDFPKAGINFKDITTLLQDGTALKKVIDHLAERYRDAGIHRIVAIESRGFIFGTALAYAMGIGVALIRKPGKLPCKTVQADYELEYGTDTIEIHLDAVESGERILLIDDLLATGGTAEAAVKLLGEVKADIHECVFIIELDFLGGRDRLGGQATYSVVHY